MPFCCAGLKARTRQSSANSTSSVITPAGTKPQKNKPKRQLVTETTTAAKKKSAKATQAGARRGLKACIRRCRSRYRLRWRTGTSTNRRHLRSGRKVHTETQPATSISFSEPEAFAECTSASPVSVKDLDLNVAKGDHTSELADSTEDTSSALISVKDQELDVNVGEDNCICEAVNSGNFENNVLASVDEEFVSTMSEDTEPATPVFVEEVGLVTPREDCSSGKAVVSATSLESESSLAAVAELLSGVARNIEPLMLDECVSRSSVSGEESGLNVSEDDSSSKPVIPAVEQVVPTATEDTELFIPDKCIGIPASVEEMGSSITEDAYSNEPLEPAVCVDDESTIAVVEEQLPTVVESAEPIVSDECVTNTPASVEKVGLNVPEVSYSSESLAPAMSVENVDSFLAKDNALSGSPVSARCISSNAASVTEAVLSLTKAAISSLERVVDMTETQRDAAETSDVLPVATAAASSSSPAVVMVCSANCFYYCR